MCQFVSLCGALPSHAKNQCRHDWLSQMLLSRCVDVVLKILQYQPKTTITNPVTGLWSTLTHIYAISCLQHAGLLLSPLQQIIISMSSSLMSTTSGSCCIYIINFFLLSGHNQGFLKSVSTRISFTFYCVNKHTMSTSFVQCIDFNRYSTDDNLTKCINDDKPN